MSMTTACGETRYLSLKRVVWAFSVFELPQTKFARPVGAELLDFPALRKAGWPPTPTRHAAARDHERALMNCRAPAFRRGMRVGDRDRGVANWQAELPSFSATIFRTAPHLGLVGAETELPAPVRGGSASRGGSAGTMAVPAPVRCSCASRGGSARRRSP